MSYRKLLLLVTLSAALAQCLSGCATSGPHKIETARYRMEEILTTINDEGKNKEVLKKVYSEHEGNRIYKRVTANSTSANSAVGIIFAMKGTYSPAQDSVRNSETIVLLSEDIAWEKSGGKWAQAPSHVVSREKQTYKLILSDAKRNMKKLQDDGMMKFNGQNAHAYTEYDHSASKSVRGYTVYSYTFKEAYTRFYWDDTDQLIGKEIVAPGLRYVVTITYDDSIRVQAPVAR